MALNIGYQDLLDAGVHFGHLTRKWDPRMAPYIFMERNGIHIIDLNKTLTNLEEAVDAVRELVKQNRRVMFVATKKQAKELVAQEANRLKMPYVTERWLGGMLTNFATVRKSLKKMQQIDKLLKEEGTASALNKKEKLMMGRDRDKLERVLGGIADMKGLPAALFIIDIKKEHIAVKEAHKLGIPVIGIVDTNSNPLECDYPIPANDDAFKSIALITKAIATAIEEGVADRKQMKDDEAALAEEMKAAEEFLTPEGGVAIATEAEVAVLEAPVAVAEAPAGGRARIGGAKPKAEAPAAAPKAKAPVAEVVAAPVLEVAAAPLEAPVAPALQEVPVAPSIQEAPAAPAVEEAAPVAEAVVETPAEAVIETPAEAVVEAPAEAAADDEIKA